MSFPLQSNQSISAAFSFARPLLSWELCALIFLQKFDCLDVHQIIRTDNNLVFFCVERSRFAFHFSIATFLFLLKVCACLYSTFFHRMYVGLSICFVFFYNCSVFLPLVLVGKAFLLEPSSVSFLAFLSRICFKSSPLEKIRTDDDSRSKAGSSFFLNKNETFVFPQNIAQFHLRHLCHCVTHKHCMLRTCQQCQRGFTNFARFGHYAGQNLLVQKLTFTLQRERSYEMLETVKSCDVSTTAIQGTVQVGYSFGKHC